ISDVVGETGQRIIRACLAGERNGQVLAKLKHFRIRATEEEIAKSLQGNWREEHLFALKQAVAQRVLRQLTKTARKLGFQLIPNPQSA
ncbi:MAG: hypothetical protein ACREXM_13770, partial [Gammaproteobacteria bacterium]